MSCREIADMRFAREGGGERRLPLRWDPSARPCREFEEPLNVIDDPRGGRSEQSAGQGVRIGGRVEVVDLLSGSDRR